jgi:hypothetical protein
MLSSKRSLYASRMASARTLALCVWSRNSKYLGAGAPAWLQEPQRLEHADDQSIRVALVPEALQEGERELLGCLRLLHRSQYSVEVLGTRQVRLRNSRVRLPGQYVCERLCALACQTVEARCDTNGYPLLPVRQSAVGARGRGHG